MSQTYSRRDVDRAFRKFNDTVRDLFQAKFQTWGDTFSHLMTHCEQDSVMKVVTEPLRKNVAVDAEKWHANVMGAVGRVGSGRYTLPYDDDDRTALLYQFFLLVENDKVDISRFCIAVFGTTKFQEAVDCFNQELVMKFTREVSYRLDEIVSDLGDQKNVPREAMIVFHDHSTNIHGNVQGSNIATGGSSISDAAATYTTNAEVAQAIKALKPLIKDVVENQRDAVEAALGVLAKAVTDQSVPSDAVEKAAITVATGSSALNKGLIDIVKKLAISLAGSTIFQGLKMAFGVH